MRNKVFLSLLTLGLLTTSVFAANVDIYPNYVIVKDQWNGKIGGGESAGIEWNLPENVDVGSFTILDPQINILSRVEAIQSGSLISHNVTVWTVNNAYRGMVKEYGHMLVLVDPQTGQTVAMINPNQIVSIVLDDDKSSTNSLKLEVKNTGNESVEELNVRYFASGINWAVKYVLQLDGNMAVLNGEYQIENNTNTEIEDAQIRLIAKNDMPYLLKSREVALFAAANVEDTSVPSVDHKAETAVYTIPGKVTIPANSRLRLLLLKEDDLELQRVYRMNNNVVNVELSLKGITQALPAGEIQIFDGDILVGTQYLSSKPAQSELVLNLGQTLDIAGKREQVNYSDLDDIYTNEYAVTLKNNKNEKVTVEVVVNLPREDAKLITDENLQVKRISSYSAVISVEVEEGSEITFSYQTRYGN